MTHEEIHPTRFKPGVSGNPNGRPKKGENQTVDEVAQGLINLAKTMTVNLHKNPKFEKLNLVSQYTVLEKAFKLHGIQLAPPDGFGGLPQGNNIKAIQVIFGDAQNQLENETIEEGEEHE